MLMLRRKGAHLLLVFFLLVAVSGAGSAEIYKWAAGSGFPVRETGVTVRTLIRPTFSPTPASSNDCLMIACKETAGIPE
ncbi:hypothetical protein OQJ46_11840 [Microbulbifer thermotolerans]|uniref:hypothetical protein n=1 Tax=Microbulbifer thermotolerans TaxID=252514 RepID=UPI00224AD5F4|nr:hypothetical protein [Microbulbifer thermotolerans]MCX2783677.1 hypothetical protein [Microbulbifer thermotolerans]